jgi:hypothetical protein
LRIALRIESPSPEALLLEEVLGQFGKVDVLGPWDIRSHTSVYDLAVGAGPVTSCPLAKQRLLFVLGPTAAHQDFDWDVAVVTSPKAQKNASLRFKTHCRVCLHPMPLLSMEAGKRRLRDNVSTALCASPIPPSEVYGVQMSLWAWTKERGPFSAMEFNSLCRHGAYGYYCGLDDGYDVQARRHLALGSPVVCDCDPNVLGSLVDHCVPLVRLLPSKKEVVADRVGISEYVRAIEEMIRSI